MGQLIIILLNFFHTWLPPQIFYRLLVFFFYMTSTGFIYQYFGSIDNTNKSAKPSSKTRIPSPDAKMPLSETSAISPKVRMPLLKVRMTSPVTRMPSFKERMPPFRTRMHRSYQHVPRWRTNHLFSVDVKDAFVGRSHMVLSAAVTLPVEH